MNTHYLPATTIRTRSIITLIAVSALAITLACGNSSRDEKSIPQMKEKNSPPDDISVIILGNGKYQINDKPANASELENILQKEIENRSTKTVIVKGNSDVTVKDIVFALDTANKVGAEGIATSAELGKKLEDEGLITIEPPRDTKIK